MYKIKQIPEDFCVKELMESDFKERGYSCYLLKKKNYTTLKAIEIISEKLRLRLKDFGYAGNKDKNAVTEQFISVKTNKNLENIKIKDIELKFLGYLDKKIGLGSNLGNHFEIVVRNLNKEYNGIKSIVNYFDEQRFSKNNVLIGKYLLQRKFKEICNLLELDAANAIDSLSKMNRKLSQFYLHSYQSYVFNKAVSLYLKNKYKNYRKIKYSLGEFVFVDEFEKLMFPLVSFDAKFTEKDKIYLKLLKEENIKLEQFLIREMPFLINETVYRDVFVKVKNFKILDYKKDELNPGKFKQTIGFGLPKGSYATILIKQMFF